MRLSSLVTIAALALGCPVSMTVAQDPAASRPVITIADAVEEGRHLLVAAVTLDGRPVEGAKVAFAVERTFGLLALGEEETIDDGTAAVPFPEGLPGGPAGELRIRAEIIAPPGIAGARGTATLGGGRPFSAESEPFPPALWSPVAPPAMIATIIVLIGGVWAAFGYVVLQMRRIRHGGST